MVSVPGRLVILSKFLLECASRLHAQVMGSVEAWQELGVRDRMERLVAPGWEGFWPMVKHSLMRMSGARSHCSLSSR